MQTYPFETSAIRVTQPLGMYYVAVLPARLLLDVSFSHTMTAALKPGGESYSVDGTQRLRDPKRLAQITDYIDRTDAAFPNSIILAANFDRDTDVAADPEAAEDDEASEREAAAKSLKLWTVTERPDGCFRLTIPTAEKLAAVIDGQHRLFSFPDAKPERLDMDLICAVFLDLPKPFQAQLFATINSTQKQVDKSLTYELFGYNVLEESPELWTPDKLAVFLTRKLNTDTKSPLRGRILVAPKRDTSLLALNEAAAWKVSTAVIVEGILRLFSTNPKRDTNAMMTGPGKGRHTLADGPRDKSPLRAVYLQGNDALIYTLILNYCLACDELLWAPANYGSFITKTVGVQALFDVLRKLVEEAVEKRDVSVSYFKSRLSPAADIDFSAQAFRIPSGSGRVLIRRTILEALQLP